MAITSTLNKILDRKQWEMCSPCPVAATNGSFIVSSTLEDQLQLFMSNLTTPYLYDPSEDSWQLLPPPTGLLGTFGAASCGTHSPVGPNGVATAGSANTLTTALNIPGSLAGYKIRIVSGTGAGQERTILRNTFGANSVITTTTNWTVNPDATSNYVLMTGRFWVFIGSATAPGMGFYDVATNTWTVGRSVAGLPTAWATDAKLRSTPSNYQPFATGTAAGGGTSTTLIKTGATWAVNQWAWSQVRILTGTGAGQVRTIASNTATTLTVSAAWTVTPDATSTFQIEGNDDFLWLAGNGAVALYRYSISANTWTTIAPAVARAAAPSTGMNLAWVASATDPAWTNESAIINGRRLYSFRAGGSAILDYYDIPSNSWVALPYGRQGETFTSGTSWDNAGNGRLFCQKDVTSRFFRYDAVKNLMEPWSVLPYPQGLALMGDRMFTIDFISGGDKVTYVYHMRNSGTELFRCLIF